MLQRGGMSIVYAAEHIRMQRRVALKILATELGDDDRFRERFLNESRTAASISFSTMFCRFRSTVRWT
jgi:serine/threonine-protein kinase